MATKYWVSNAVTAYDLWTISLSGTVISQTYSMTINGKSVSYAAGGSDTVTIILAALAAAWNASTIPEFAEATATALPVGGPYTSMTITGDTAGNPLTISVATGGGSTYSIAHTTTATGPNDFGNAQNWSTGTVPANADVLVFDNGKGNCCFGLSTSLTGVTVIVNPGFTGQIGLPALNSNSQSTYNEYRTRALTLAGGTLTINAPSMQLGKFAFGANTTTVMVQATGSRLDKYTPPVLITGGNGSSQLDMTKGDVGIAFYQSETAQFPTILTSYSANAATDVTLYCGPGATLGAITKNGGTLTVNSNVTTLTQGVSGGVVNVNSGAVTTLVADNGTVNYNSTGTLGTVTITGNAVLNFDFDPRAKTITNPILVYGNSASVSDNAKVVNSGTLSVTTNQTTYLNVSHGAGNVCTFA